MPVKKKVAVVTGSNKGIGYEVVKILCSKFDGVVYLTARNFELGHKAVNKLREEGIYPNFHQLDISNSESIRLFVEYLKQTYGGIDILVNNAAIYPKESTDILKNSKETININFTGTLNLCNSIFPLLRTNARVVHVSSKLGLLCRVTDQKLRDKISNPFNTIEDITNIIEDYLKACEDGTYKAKGYPEQPYDFSKVVLNALTPIQQEIFDKQLKNIVVSGVCPGYCKTDMTQNKGILPPEVGALKIVNRALIPADYNGSKGKFWSKDKEFDWINGELGNTLNGSQEVSVN